MNQNSIKVAAAQVSPCFMDREKTVEKACDVIAQAGKKGVRFLVFPEVFIPGYPDWVWVVKNSQSSILNDLYVELLKNAVSIPDESTQKLCKAAKEANLYLAMGIHEINTEASKSSLYNTILYISDKGEILGKHRKLVPTGGERLIWSQGDGSTLNSFDTAIGKIGGLICWENFMPLARQTMYNHGVQIYAAPTWDKSERWLISLQHIAREGGMYVLGACMALRMKDIPDRYQFKKEYPDGRDWINVGNSCIISPDGKFIAGPVEKKEDIIYADIDLNLITASKRMFDVAGHYSRPDVFNFGIKKEK